MMNSKEIFKKVGGIIAELTEQYQYLSKSPDKMNELELELFLANSNFLSDHIEILRKINKNAFNIAAPSLEIEEPKQHSKLPETSIEKDKVKDEQKVEKEYSITSAEPVEVEETQPAAEDGSEKEEPEENKSAEEKKIEKEVINEKPEVTEKAPEEIVELEEKEETIKSEETSERNKPAESSDTELADKPLYSQDVTTNTVIQTEKTIVIEDIPLAHKPTINDMLSKSSDNSIAAKLNHTPITDLKSSISLNDKLLFVKDLFNGYSLAYSEAIDLLNRFNDFESADTFLKINYSVKNRWVERQATADKLYEILERRFMK